MNESDSIIVVTGASGFLGTNLCQHFFKQGYKVRALVRDKSKSNHLTGIAKAGLVEYDLGKEINPAILEGNIEAVIHCAWGVLTSNHSSDLEANITGTQKLLSEVRRRHGVRFIFISSMSAHEAAESTYGLSKKYVEELLDPAQDTIIRPGLIIGNGGLFSRMKESIARFPVVPLFYGGKQAIQIIHVSDLCKAVELSIKNELTGTLYVAVNTPIQIRDFYNALAAESDRECKFVYLPGTVSLWTLIFCEKLGIKLPISSENLKGLKCMRTFETQSDLARIGIDPTNDLSHG